MATAKSERSDTRGTGAQATTTTKTRLKRLTRIAGILYLAIFVLYPLSTSVRSTLVVPGDAATTVQNVVANETLFRWGMAGEATIFLIEIVLAGVLYVLLRPVSRWMSLAAALARASEGVVMAAANLFTSILTLVVVGGAGYLAAFDTEQRDALALLFQDANEIVILLWGLFFALHLVLLGLLVYWSQFFPRILGILLMLAGVGYFAQSFGTVVAPGLAGVLSTGVLVLAIPGELVFALWLLIRGVDMDKWHTRALEAIESQL
ncbi:MAG: DUF4386 domain-containing protein [Trueperaceae bacterium]|nr:MAG: DUF4386 domain-containing protein [Trueperaceae bacterium]